MKLVFIYGAPGVGKLTTAQALATLTGFRLFHNHQSFNLVKSIFDFPSAPFLELLGTIRLATLDAAARAGTPGLVFTFVYAAPHDDRFVAQVVDVVERHGGEVLFVRLSCDADTQEQRVVAGERQALGKLASVDSLRAMMKRWNVTAAIPFGRTFDIDNSTLAADVVARRIAAHFSLPVRMDADRGGIRA